MWYVYIAQAKTGRFYVGITTDSKKRIIKHNSGKGSRFAVIQGPLNLVYVSPMFGSKSEARKREIQIKIWSRKKKIKLINGDWIYITFIHSFILLFLKTIPCFKGIASRCLIPTPNS